MIEFNKKKYEFRKGHSTNTASEINKINKVFKMVSWEGQKYLYGNIYRSESKF